jgi:heptose-I-phosphate ethanolaminephosphotransferase
MSLFGYVRKTTPTLDRLKPELEIAADACSSQTTTIAQMKELLTFATREDPSPLFRAPSLVQIMKSEGFKIYWLSNQQMVGPTDTWSAVFSKPADLRIFTDKRGGFEGASHDGKLLPLLREALTDPADHRFIVLHLMGTHVHYDLRYPREFARFNDRRGVHPGVLQKGGWYITRYTQYDNAVLYNDYILGEIISRLKAVERGTLTYVSDHGEVLGETSSATGHWGGNMPRQGYQVPLLFYLTPKVKTELGERLAVFRRNLAVPIQTDRLIHTLLDLYDIRDEEWRPERSLFSPHFSASPRQCDTRPE